MNDHSISRVHEKVGHVVDSRQTQESLFTIIPGPYRISSTIPGMNLSILRLFGSTSVLLVVVIAVVPEQYHGASGHNGVLRFERLGLPS